MKWWCAVLALFFVGTSSLGLPGETIAQTEISGVAFEDVNGNGIYDSGESGLANVSVSNGLDVVQTDSAGRYSLPVYDEMIVFVSKPAGYMIPMDANNVPRFYYVHQPQGSPEFIREYEGIEPTGDLPESIDFPLYRREESDTFEVIVFGDTQVTDDIELSYLRDWLIPELQDTQAAFGIAMGDLVNDTLSLYPRYQSVMGALGIPTYYVPGNHDMNFDSRDDVYHFETYKSHFGPTYYSFDYGQVHFVVMENVRWTGGRYTGAFRARQLQWLENDLAHVAEDKLIVLNMHIPLITWDQWRSDRVTTSDRPELFEILDGRLVLALAGHKHTIERYLPGETYRGWDHEMPFTHIIVGAVSGGWWSPPFDEAGIPLSYQRDGTPKGYMVFQFDGTDYTERYVAYGRLPDDQMNLSLAAPRSETYNDLGYLQTGESALVIANVFSGSRDSVVAYRINDGEWLAMEGSDEIPDPFASRVIAGVSGAVAPRSTNHLWVAQLPIDLSEGVHIITVQTTDQYGQVASKTITVEVR